MIIPMSLEAEEGVFPWRMQVRGNGRKREGARKEGRRKRAAGQVEVQKSARKAERSAVSLKDSEESVNPMKAAQSQPSASLTSLTLDLLNQKQKKP